MSNFVRTSKSILVTPQRVTVASSVTVLRVKRWFDVLVFLAGVFLCGTLYAKSHRIYPVIPLRCMHEIKITDFTKPCKVDAKNPNMAFCDGVRIHFACIEYPSEGKP